MQEVRALFQKELQLELRQKHTLAGIVLYVLSTVFVCYLALESLDSGRAWAGLIWITGLFTAFNAMQKTFLQEGNSVHLYLYTLAHPRSIILAKSLYNALLVAFLNLTSVFFFLLFFGGTAFEHANIPQFLVGLFLGSTGLGVALTFVAGLAYKADNGIGLVAILGFPLLIPLLITIVRFTTHCLDGGSWEANSLQLLVLIVLNVASFLLALLLFPYLWRD
jgi:heme exporter protein B